MIERALCPVLVDREEPFAALEDALLAANRTEGGIVVLSGEAGVGKTRLAEELAKSARRAGMTVMTGTCAETELALPYLPFLEAIGNYLDGLSQGDLDTAVGGGRAELSRLFPQLAGGSPAPDGGDPAQAKLRLFEAMLTLLRGPADRSGLLLQIDDVQWADPSTRELLDYFSRRLRGARIMLLATLREGELTRKDALSGSLASWRRAGLAEVIPLAPLTPKHIGGMVMAIFNEDQVTDEFQDVLFQQTEGNPFVLEEILKHAIDRGDIYVEDDHWRRKPIAELSIPPTVVEAILTRVERLDPEHAEVLRAASVLGRSFAYEQLRALTGKDDALLNEALRECFRQQLLETEPSAPSRYRFRHSLTREAVYEELIEPERVELHRRVAETLRGLPDTDPAELGYHLLEAGRLEEAIPICLTAAAQAAGRRGYREAGRLLERVLPHVRDDLDRSRVLRQIGEAYWGGEDAATARRYLTEAVELLEAAGKAVEAAELRLTLGRCEIELSRVDLAAEQYERARATLEPFGPSESLAMAYGRLASQAALSLDPVRAEVLARQAIAIADKVGAAGPRIGAYIALGIALSYQAKVDEALEHFDRAYREASTRRIDWMAELAVNNTIQMLCEHLRAGEAVGAMALLDGVGGGIFRDLMRAGCDARVKASLGDLSGAKAAVETGLRLAQGAGLTRHVTRFEVDLAWNLIDLGRFDDAARILQMDTGGVMNREERLGEAMTWIRFHLGRGAADQAAASAQPFVDQVERAAALPPDCDEAVQALTGAGRLDDARRLLAAVRQRWATSGSPHLDRMEGHVALLEGDAGKAAGSLSRAATGFAQAGYRLEECRTRLSLARAHQAAGDRAAAGREVEIAATIAAEIGAEPALRFARELAADLGIELIDRTAPVLKVSEPAPVATLDSGSERVVTILFADVRGFTAMSREKPPDDMADRMSAFYRWARREVEQRKGVIDELRGDSVMATFNLSAMRLDHCLLALQAGLALVDRAALAGLPLGVGIAVGPAVVGSLIYGDKVSVVGEPANLASRLQASASGGEILISEEAFRRVRTWLADQSIETEARELQLKGFDAPVTAHLVRARVASTITAPNETDA